MMLRRLALAALLLAPLQAQAEPFAIIGNTPPTLDSSDRLATTQWVNNLIAAGLTLQSGKIWIGSAGNIATPQIPSGDCTLSITGVVTCTQSAGNFLVNGTLTVSGSVIDGNGILATNIVAPATPAAGTTRVYVDSTQKVLTFKNDAGTVGNAVVPSTCGANLFGTSISAAGVFGCTQPAVSNISGFGTGVAAALGVNVGSAGAPVLFNGAGGTPTSLTLTNGTGLPVAGITGLGTGVGTALGTNLGGAGALEVLGQSSISNCTLVASVSSNNLTIALKTQAGADPSSSSPCAVSFRSATAATGNYTPVSVTAATNIVFNSGSGFGAPSSSTPFRIWITAWNNSGTVVLGASNQTNTTDVLPIFESAVQSSTACNACATATSAGVFYTTAAQTNEAIRILGYMEWASGLTTTGVWASGPTTIQLMGPGVYKPGDIVHAMYVNTSSGTTSTSASFAATALARNFTMASPANTISMHVDGTTANNTASGSGIQLRIYRGSAACTTAASPVSFAVIAASGVAQSSFSFFDFPYASETTTAQYTVCFASPNSPNSITFPFASGSAQLLLNEIMG